jgi:hypothetical protein
MISWALQAKWSWLEKTDPNRPWHGLNFPIPKQVRKFFASSIISVIGNGTNTFFGPSLCIPLNTVVTTSTVPARLRIGGPRLGILGTYKLKWIVYLVPSPNNLNFWVELVSASTLTRFQSQRSRV